MPDLSSVAVDSWVSYLVALLVPGLDAVLPFLPSETILIAIGVVAADTHDPRTLVLFAFGVLSAWGGDNLSYLLGRRFGNRVVERYLRGERGERAVRWADRALAERAATLLILARFIPGGRTALTLVAGSRRYPWHRFRVYTAVAAALWGTYSAGLGYLGGRRFEDNSLLALGVALAAGLTITALIELGRSQWSRHRRRAAAVRGTDPRTRADDRGAAAEVAGTADGSPTPPPA
jgi:membrane-associated protein